MGALLMYECDYDLNEMMEWKGVVEYSRSRQGTNLAKIEFNN